jgi:hypothetical protein
LETDATMSTPELLPVDGDPPEGPGAADSAPALRDQPEIADTPRTEHPVPESFLTAGSNGTDA